MDACAVQTNKGPKDEVKPVKRGTFVLYLR